MGKRGPKPWEPTEAELSKIELYAGLGSTQEQVATLLGKSVNTLKAGLGAKDAFERGKAQTIAKVAGSLVSKALAGDTASAIFYLKTQAGWKETNVSENYSHIIVEQIGADADDFTRRIARLASRDGAGAGTGETQH